jgi:hypothetical protein
VNQNLANLERELTKLKEEMKAMWTLDGDIGGLREAAAPSRAKLEEEDGDRKEKRRRR